MRGLRVDRQVEMIGKGLGRNEVWTDGKAVFGHVWEDRLNTGLSGLDDDAKAALAANGIYFDFKNVVPEYPEG